MRISRLVTTGAVTVVAGVALLGLSLHTPGSAIAGGALPCDPTPTPTPQAGNVAAGRIQAAQVAPTCTPAASSTPVRLKTHTPTATATPKPVTNTPVPNTPTPPTLVPTRRAGGNEGVAVKPPDTGAGPGAGGAAGPLAVLFGVALLMLGGGGIAVGARRRN